MDVSCRESVQPAAAGLQRRQTGDCSESCARKELGSSSCGPKGDIDEERSRRRVGRMIVHGNSELEQLCVTASLQLRGSCKYVI